jgi:ribosome-associated protein
MSRKPRKGYFVRGQFVPEGSELDLEYKRALKGGLEVSKTDLKRESAQLQDLGEELMSVSQDLRDKLQLPEKLGQALDEAARIRDFEGRRRQLQYVGKLMRSLEPEELETIRQTLATRNQGSAQEIALLHQAEQWRLQLLADDQALAQWVEHHPSTDVQQLRALVRQARKDAKDQLSQAGQAPRQGRAYRDIFQMLKEHLHD